MLEMTTNELLTLYLTFWGTFCVCVYSEAPQNYHDNVEGWHCKGVHSISHAWTHTERWSGVVWIDSCHYYTYQ